MAFREVSGPLTGTSVALRKGATERLLDFVSTLGNVRRFLLGANVGS